MDNKVSFTMTERLFAGLGLAIATLGLVNWAVLHRTMSGLMEKQTAMAAFIPLILVVCFVAPTSRLARVRDE